MTNLLTKDLLNYIMSQTKKDSSSLTLKLDGGLTVSQFKEAFTAFADVAQSVSKTLISEKVEWCVDVAEGSVLVHLTPTASHMPPLALTELVGTIASGFRQLERRAELERPHGFNDDAMAGVKRLASLSNDELTVTVKSDEFEQKVTTQSIASVDSYLAPAYVSDGMLDGELMVISAKNEKLELRLIDSITGSKVRCIVSEKLESQILPAFRRRIEVSGEIKYRADGRPVLITVKEFKLLPKDDELPTVKDFFTMLRKVNYA